MSESCYWWRGVFEFDCENAPGECCKVEFSGHLRCSPGPKSGLKNKVSKFKGFGLHMKAALPNGNFLRSHHNPEKRTVSLLLSLSFKPPFGRRSWTHMACNSHFALVLLQLTSGTYKKSALSRTVRHLRKVTLCDTVYLFILPFVHVQSKHKWLDLTALKLAIEIWLACTSHCDIQFVQTLVYFRLLKSVGPALHQAPRRSKKYNQIWS